MKKFTRIAAVGVCLALLLSVLAACNPSQSSSTTTLTVGTVNNSQMVQMEQLTTQVFQKDHPNIKVNFVTLPENELRSKVTQDVATNAGKFDIATIGSYETPIWAHNGWIQDLSPYFSKMMYNKQIFAQHNLTMPLHPTWDQIAKLAQQLNDPAHGVTGILLRGQSGWGMNMAPLDTMINTFGGSWFDQNWKPQLSTPPVQQAVTLYANLLQNYGEPGASTAGWEECLSLMAQGKGAMFYDATSLAGVLETPSQSKVAGQMGYAYAPTAVTTNGSRWLWAWSLDMIK